MICETNQQQHENCPSLVDDNDNDVDNSKLFGGSRRKRENWLVKHGLQLPELPSEIWVEIMGKLPIKALYGCKCVSKAWHSHVSHFLTTQKGIDLPPYGLLFMTFHPTSNDDSPDRNHTRYLAFLSLVGDYKLTKWSLNDFEPESATVTMGDHQSTHNDHSSGGSGLSLGNLTLEFGTLMSAMLKYKAGYYWNVHRGLFLVVLDLYTYLVYNLATKEAFYLSRPASQSSVKHGSTLVSIINLSDCPLSSECNFRVLRFLKACSETKTKGMVFVEVYSSNKRDWCVSKFLLNKEVILEKWCVLDAVLVNDTLFFLTNKRHAVGVQFHSSGQVRKVYSLRLPRRIIRGFCESKLDASQGCLYLFYDKSPNLWIWKHTGSSTNSDAWIPQLIFKKSGISLCPSTPNIDTFMRQCVANDVDTYPMIMHPKAPVVFFFVRPSIFAIHLLNDTVEKIDVELNEREVPLTGTAFMYAPCFASFKCLKPANQDHCK